MMSKMKYKKGSKVEVLDTKEVPLESWRSAEIICGNGHNYTVRYDIESGVTDEPAVVERVSRKSIRPSPPCVNFSNAWVSGDVVEVLHNCSWKVATVSKIVERNHFLVRLRGSAREFKVHSLQLRVRQNWLHNRWVVIGKRTCDYQLSNPDGKRKLPYSSSQAEPPSGIRKLRVAGRFSMDVDKPREEDEDNIASCSSVGSCSLISKNCYKIPQEVYRVPSEDIEEQSSSDAESVCFRQIEERKSFVPSKEALAGEIHRLELNAYRSTIEALHASGPLSWEKESLMTNLRLSLHISNDEHLTELRNLAATR
ncbi:uncharacterized protein LOC124931170 [Impatiens glandulifera]|uniref:uncharacterized protein LOC124931170 n=1 Tax=Impatiens glandulifera TaxID=253017 RepID=UPI001FB13C63|nr:uncharacterized protein LOC124931170 [Impatiens glandulifera]